MNAAQRRALLAHSPCVRREWWREWRECRAADLSEQAARELADAAAQREHARQQDRDSAAMGWPSEPSREVHR